MINFYLNLAVEQTRMHYYVNTTGCLETVNLCARLACACVCLRVLANTPCHLETELSSETKTTILRCAQPRSDWGVTRTSNRVTSNGVTGKRVTAKNTDGKFLRKRVTAKNTEGKFLRKRVTAKNNDRRLSRKRVTN